MKLVLIYEKIYKVKDKHNMIQVNKYFYNLFQSIPIKYLFYNYI
jgi:hypothetical protein